MSQSNLSDLLRAAAAEVERSGRPGLAKASPESENTQRWLEAAWQRFVQLADQAERSGMSHADIAFAIELHKTSFSNLYNHGYTLRNQVQARHLIALEEVVRVRTLRRVIG